MSVDLIEKLLDSKAIEKPELRVLLGVAKSTVYQYTNQTELRYGQLVNLFKFAEDDRVREAILDELVPGSGFVVTRLSKDLDLNGDGAVDSDDALKSIIETIDQSSKALKVVLKKGGNSGTYIDARKALSDAAEKTLAAVQVLDWLEQHEPRRKQARRAV